MVNIYTIGFTKKSAQTFFTLLGDNNVKLLIDTRLKPNSQLSGFARGNDLPYFLEHLSNCKYQHMLSMAPTEELLNQYRKEKSWTTYEQRFKRLLNERNLIQQLDPLIWKEKNICLLCSEHKPLYCHRRLVAEYIQSHWTDSIIHHLL